MKLVFATRKSALALAQSRAFVAELVAAQGETDLVVEELHITTSGDRFQDQRLQDIGGKGLFIKELEEALLDARADFAVHSIKDVPAELVPGLEITCIPKRADPRDVIATKQGSSIGSIDELPRGARIGTSSLRRAVCLKKLRPDFVIEPLRGNVDTRLRKVDEGAYDGVVLAFAGLSRLGLAHRASIVLTPEQCVPAVGQGALGIESRASDERVKAILAPIVDDETSVAVAAERALMARVGGNCRMPIAAHAIRSGDRMHLVALVADADGSRAREGAVDEPWPKSAADAARIGRDLGAQLA